VNQFFLHYQKILNFITKFYYHMKKVQVFSFLLFFIMALPACEQENNFQQQEKWDSDWLSANLQTIDFETNSQYLFPTSQLKQMLDNQEVTTVLFAPCLQNQAVFVKMIGINQKGEQLMTQLIRPIANQPLVHQKDSHLAQARVAPQSPVIQKHLISVEKGLELRENWNTLPKEALEEATSYNKERIRYFSYEAEALQYLVNTNTEHISLSWGVNEEQKMTTVFFPIQKIEDGRFFIKSQVEEVMDLGTPCPSTCRP